MKANFKFNPCPSTMILNTNFRITHLLYVKWLWKMSVVSIVQQVHHAYTVRILWWPTYYCSESVICFCTGHLTDVDWCVKDRGEKNRNSASYKAQQMDRGDICSVYWMHNTSLYFPPPSLPLHPASVLSTLRLNTLHCTPHVDSQEKLSPVLRSCAIIWLLRRGWWLSVCVGVVFTCVFVGGLPFLCLWWTDWHGSSESRH